jgi:hypothetical protein
MVRMMKRNMRSLVLLLTIAIATMGFLDVRSFAVPAVAGLDNSNQSQTRTKSHPRTGGSPTKAPAVCRKRCDNDYSACLTPSFGPVFVEQCGTAHAQCLKECKR